MLYVLIRVMITSHHRHSKDETRTTPPSASLYGRTAAAPSPATGPLGPATVLGWSA